MEDENVTKGLEEDVDQAIEAERAAQRAERIRKYTITFKTPFKYEGREYEKLEFDFGAMTGKDYLAVEDEVMAKGRNVVTAQFSTPFLVGLAARACTTRSEDGRRLPSAAFENLDIVRFNNLITRMKNFFWQTVD